MRKKTVVVVSAEIYIFKMIYLFNIHTAQCTYYVDYGLYS